MFRFKSILGSVFISLLFVGVFCSSASSVTLIVEDGQLMGADNVDVNGSLYDVRFVDESAMDLYFDGTSWNFTFTDEASARAASQALLDTVFIDSSLGLFDSIPILTNGINDNYGNINGQVETPFAMVTEVYEPDPEDPDAEVPEPETLLYSMQACNFAPEDSYGRDDRVEFVASSSEAWDVDLSWYHFVTYAVWTEAANPVPIPGALLLMGSGLLGLAGIRRRQK